MSIWYNPKLPFCIAFYHKLIIILTSMSANVSYVFFYLLKRKREHRDTSNSDQSNTGADQGNTGRTAQQNEGYENAAYESKDPPPKLPVLTCNVPDPA